MTFFIDIFTLFPEYISGPSTLALLGKAQDNDIVKISTHDLRGYTHDVHRSVDDQPYGGGAGMVMMPEPIFDAVEKVQPKRPLYVLSASGKKFTQEMAVELSRGDGFSLICGRYEGVDQRVTDHLADGEICVGDFVLAGGEAGALIVIEAVTRLLDGVMGNDESGVHESFSDTSTDAVLEAPQYTRPASFRGHDVPEVLLSGNHGAIEQWRRDQSVAKTKENRGDLLD